jgi:predicted ribosome quality control (RQC) complex YloA/Tae2 family protein
VKALDARLKGLQLLECYSQNKDELILAFGLNDTSFIIRAILGSRFSALAFPKDTSRAKRNSVSLFEDLIGMQVSKVIFSENDRSFRIEFGTDHILVFKMHGNRSNILLFKQEALVEKFNNQLRKDDTLTLADLNKSIDQSLSAWVATPNLKTLFPTFGAEITEQLYNLGFEGSEANQQWQLISKLLEKMQTPKFYIEVSDDKPQLTLFESGKTVSSTSDAIEACNLLTRYYTQVYLLQESKAKIEKTVSSQLTSTKHYIEKTEQKLNELLQKRSYSEIGDIIMANLHQIPKNATQVILEDFYSNAPITIKIPVNNTPQKLAENYYRKSKNQALETNMLITNIEKKEADLTRLKMQLQDIDRIDNYKELQKYADANIKTVSDNIELISNPYFEHFIEGFRVLVGKNAKGNDELLRSYTSKNDLWLHARNSAGSHVIIKEIKSKPFTQIIIEKAAQLAAFYSKSKNDTLCPVIYTPRKYVRKAKHLAPGQVLVEKEKVVLVAPSAKV